MMPRRLPNSFPRTGMLHLCLTAALATAASAHSYTHNDIMIGHAWAPPSAGNNAQVYMPLVNGGSQADRLLSAATPVAGSARLRVEKDGVEAWPEAVDLPPGKPYALTAWREHIWLQDLDRTLKNGDRFPLTLRFERAGEIEIEIYVEDAPGH